MIQREFMDIANRHADEVRQAEREKMIKDHKRKMRQIRERGHKKALGYDIGIAMFTLGILVGMISGFASTNIFLYLGVLMILLGAYIWQKSAEIIL